MKNERKQVAHFRDLLQQTQHTHNRQFTNGISVCQLITDYANCVDSLIVSAWQQHPGTPSATNMICIIALGGYGRQQLHPYSDIDLLFLTDNQWPSSMNHVLETFIALLWDIGLTISQRVFTVDDCIDAARADLSLMSSLLESRYLTGNRHLLSQLHHETATKNMWPSNAFYHAKLQERTQRLAKYDNTAYQLEPNVKNSPGGLRDLHLFFWIAKRHFAVHQLHELVDHGLLTNIEYRSLIMEQTFLWQIRYALHLLAKRAQDRLLFPYQTQLAQQFGYRDQPQHSAVKQFMQRYFSTTKNINELVDMLLHTLHDICINQATLAI